MSTFNETIESFETFPCRKLCGDGLSIFFLFAFAFPIFLFGQTIDKQEVKSFEVHEEIVVSNRLGADQLIPSGSFIIDMGVVPQTEQNALKPYGLVWEILNVHEIPVLWSINPNKGKDGVDFIYSGNVYKGGPFIILAEYRTATVNATINKWINQGVVGVTSNQEFLAPIYQSIDFSIQWTLDQENGDIAAEYLTVAGIPSTAYNWKLPYELGCCEDVFIMPHAHPDWNSHSHLLDWNNDFTEGGCRGAIWAGCNAVSNLENIRNPSNRSEKMNFLMNAGPNLNSFPAVEDGDHDGGTSSLTYNHHAHPIMQFLGSMYGAQENGAEQVYLPKYGWRDETLIGIEDFGQEDIPDESPGPAGRLVFGHGFGDDTKGFVAYEAAHKLNKDDDPANIAAQRAFLNFSFYSASHKSIEPLAIVPSSVQSGVSYQLLGSASGGTGTYNYTWTSSCGGSFSNSNTENTSFTAPEVTENTSCLIRLTVSDDCGSRQAFSPINVEIEPPVPPSCNCDENLLINGSFEDGTINGWNTEKGVVKLFVADMDDCGNTTLELGVNNSVTKYMAFWQQENFIEPFASYKLTFEASTVDASLEQRVYLQFFNEEGALLSEGYKEVDFIRSNNQELENYSLFLSAPLNAKFARINVRIEGGQRTSARVYADDEFYIDNLCLTRTPCTFRTMSFQQPKYLSGIWGDENSEYRFFNVYSGIDAILTIVNKSHTDVVIEKLDQPETDNEGYDWAFQPVIDWNFKNGNNNYEQAGEKSVNFEIRFENSSTGASIELDEIFITALDVDGHSNGIREFVNLSGFSNYQIQDPTSLSLSGSLKATGEFKDHPGIDESMHEMISYQFLSSNRINVTLGAHYNGGALNDDDEVRDHALFFKCYNFNYEQICPSISLTGGSHFCQNSSTLITGSISGNSGFCNVVWEQSNDMGETWQPINGNNSLNLQTDPLLQTTYYRSYISCNDNASCGTIYSNEIIIELIQNCDEICDNGIDDDMNGLIDEFDPACSFYCQPTSQTNVISGKVFFDEDADGSNSSDDYLIPGISIDIFLDVDKNGIIEPSDQHLTTTETDLSGNYYYTFKPKFNQDFIYEIINGCQDSEKGDADKNGLKLGKDKDIGLIFTGVQIPSGSIVNEARLAFVSKKFKTDFGSAQIYGEETNSPSDYCILDDFDTRIKTSSSMPWSFGNWQMAETYRSIDIKNIVQELIDDYNFDNGSLSFLIVSDGSEEVEANSFESTNSSEFAPKLELNVKVQNSLNYLIRINESTLPISSTLTTSSVQSVIFNDFDQSECTISFGFNSTFEICDNGIDDDGDGFIDGNDPDCEISLPCINESNQPLLSGVVFQDVNHDGELNLFEPLQDNVLVSLYEDINGNDVLDFQDDLMESTRSSFLGKYSFGVETDQMFKLVSRISHPFEDAKDGKTDEDKLKLGNRETIGLRFRKINIPPGAIITDARLTLFAKKDKDDENARIKIYGEDSSRPLDYYQDDKVELRSRTNTNVDWVFGDWIHSSPYTSPDLSVVIQELVNSYNYDNGSLALILSPNGSKEREAKSYEFNNNGADVPELSITYMLPEQKAYLVEIDTSTLPYNQGLTTPEVYSIQMNANDLNNCTINFGFNSTTEICGNGRDDDRDGLVDCDDPDCFNGLNLSIDAEENPICTNSLTQLTASASGGRGVLTYAWDNGLGSGFIKWVNPSSTTTYNVTLTDENGCEVYDAITIVVTDLPMVDIGSDDIICDNSTSFLNAVGANGRPPYTYSWSNGLGLGANKVVQPDATTIYTVTITDFNGCSNTDNVTVTVNSLPEVTAGRTDGSICIGESTTISATGGGGSGGYTYFWNNGVGLGNTHIVDPSSTTTYTVIATDANGCTNSDEILVEVVQIPNVSAGADQVICQGQSSAQLSASGGATYSWSPANSLTDSGISNPIASPSITTVYTVTITSANGCSATDQVTVSVNSTPNASSSADVAICLQSSSQLDANGGDQYEWSPSTGLSSTTIKNPIASPAMTTTYTVTITDSNNCTSTSQTVVSINSLPDADAGSDAVICNGESYSLNASGGISYQWVPSTGLNNPNIANPISQPNNTITYTVFVTDINGCTNTDQITLTILNKPTANAGNDHNTCIGQSVVLNASGGALYTWSPSTGLNADDVQSPIASPNVTTLYTLTVTSANGCTSTDIVTVNVGNCPENCDDGFDNDGDGLVDCDDPDCGPLNPYASPDQSICLGSSTMLNASGGETYLWSPTNTLSDPTIPNPIAVPLANTVYTVTITDNNGCTVIDQIEIFINNPPNAQVSKDTANLCEGGFVNIFASGGVSYEWGPTTGLSNYLVANPDASPESSILYIVTVTDGNGCSATNAIFVEVNSNEGNAYAGVDGVICIGGSTSLNASGGISYSWSPSTGLSASNIPNPVASPAVPTTYTVVVTDANGCNDLDAVFIDVAVCSEICGDGLDNDSDGLVDCADDECRPQFPNAGPDRYICIGETTRLTASGGDSYLWSPTNGLDDHTLQNPRANPLSTVTYTVDVINADGCIETDEVTVFVSSIPNAQVTNDTIDGCMGEPVVLNASGGLYYEWSPSSSLSNPTIPNPIASPSTSTLYIVTVSDGNGCYSTNVTYIRLNTNIGNATAGPDQQICKGTAGQLSASGGVTYAWSPTTGLSDPNLANPMASPSVSTNYTVVVTDVNGCTDSDQVFIDVITFTGVADAGNDVDICQNGMIQLDASGGVSVLRSFYPKLSASSIKHILMASGIQMNDKLKKPNSEEIFGANYFSVSGKTVNLYNALLYASLYKERDPVGSLKDFKAKMQ